MAANLYRRSPRASAAVVLLLILLCTVLLASCAGSAQTISAEECYSLGTLYLEQKKTNEAENWFRKAAQNKTTKNAALYQLGLIAMEKKRPEEAVGIFEQLLAEDRENTLLLEAAAYANVASGNSSRALELYDRLEQLLPLTAASRYNRGVLLYLAGDYSTALEIAEALLVEKGDDKDAMLLKARSQRRLDKPEAVDSYTAYLRSSPVPAIQLELAQLCEKLQLYARAIELYDTLLKATTSEKLDLPKGAFRFAKARFLYLAGESTASKELETAIAEGYADEAEIADLRAKLAVPAEEAPAAPAAAEGGS